MNIVTLIAERGAPLVQLSQSFEKLNQFVSQFHQTWIAVGRELQQQLLHKRIH